MNKILLLSVFLLFSSCSISQVPPKGGRYSAEAWKKADVISPVVTRGGADITSSASLRKFCPNTHIQGFADCTAWAVANALTIMDAVNSENTNTASITKEMYSPAHIYHSIKYLYGKPNDNNTDSKCENGIYLFNPSKSNAICFLMYDGCYKRKDFEGAFGKESYAHRTDDGYCFTKKHLVNKNAERKKISGYYAAKKTDDSINFQMMKEAISGRKPVVCDIRLYESFYTLNYPYEKWKKKGKDKLVFESGLPISHAITIVGYDDNKFNGQGGFLLFNSWGKNWGIDGFLWMKYSDFREIALTAYVLSKPSQKVEQIAGNIKFPLFPSGILSTKVANKHIVTTQNYDNGRFKFLLTVDQEYHAYVIGSATPTEYISLFPEKNQTAFTGHEISQIEFPTENTHFTIEAENTNDVLCVLISKKKLDNKDIQAFRQSLGNTQNVQLSLSRIFPNQYRYVNYFYNEGDEAYHFKGSFSDDRPIIPIVLEVTH